jgi:hypothetical protein
LSNVMKDITDSVDQKTEKGTGSIQKKNLKKEA